MPRPPRSTKPKTLDQQDILRDAVEATGGNQVRLAIDILGVNDRSLRGWLAGEPAWPPVVRLCWLLAEHPKLADEIKRRFDPHAE